MAKKTKEVVSRPFMRWGLLIAAFCVTLLCVGTASFVEVQDVVQVGDVAAKRYVAARDAVDEVTTEKLRVAAANSVGPIYKNDITIEETGAKQINEIFRELDDVLLSLQDGDNFYQKVQGASLNLPVVLTEKQLSAYEKMSAPNRTLLREDCIAVLNRIYSQGITADNLEAGREMVKDGIASTVWSTDMKGMAYAIVSVALEPNLVLDEGEMEKAREAKRSEVNNIMIRKNQKIVDEGEIITQDIYDRLAGLKLIGGADYKNNWQPLVGSALIVLLNFVAVGLFFLWDKRKNILKKNELSMLFTVYCITIVLLRVMAGVPYFTLIPVGLFAMLTSLLIGRRTALLMNCFYGIIGSLILSGSVEFLIYALISGSFGALLIQKTEKRSHMVPVAMGMAAANFAAVLAMGLFFGGGYDATLLKTAGFGGLMGLITVTVALGSLPFWESVFEANAPLRLLELTNPNNELLRRLMIEAPGTYHHSLIVANLAETAVYEIGGNTALARAGAYYHDIGKLKYPMFFAENQSGQNPHDDLEPKASARIITQHTKTGAEMGLEEGLPRIILDIIKEHHGNSVVKYFYFKALQTYGAENVDEADYRYDGQIPMSRESAVVMLADTVEAAVRAMLGKGKTLGEADIFIKELIKDKLDDGQLDHSGLGIHELETIRNAFLTVFHGMYHERISYPKNEEIQAAKKAKEEEEKGEENSDNLDRQQNGEDLLR